MRFADCCFVFTKMDSSNHSEFRLSHPHLFEDLSQHPTMVAWSTKNYRTKRYGDTLEQIFPFNPFYEDGRGRERSISVKDISQLLGSVIDKIEYFHGEFSMGVLEKMGDSQIVFFSQSCSAVIHNQKNERKKNKTDVSDETLDLFEEDH